MSLSLGDDTTDDVGELNYESNEGDLNQMKELNRDEWLQQYGMCL